MSTAELFALIGAIGTFITPIIAILIQKEIENKLLKVISVNRRNTLKGNWEGEFRILFPKGDKYTIQSIKMELIPSRKVVKGKGEFESAASEFGTEKVYINIEGGFKNDRFLIMNYDNNERIQFGTFLLELSPNNEILRGNLVGFGPHTEKILTGEIKFKKVH